MTLTEVFDRLLSRRVSRIEFADGSYVECQQPMVVDFHDSDTPAEAWIEPAADGLMLHFNAKRIGRGDTGMAGQEEPLSNIVDVT